jgi:UDP-glucose:(heptosyl)LPS alpha-1,3-glucosyltransferase
MKLAFCLYKYFPYGGLQRDFLRIAEECIRRGHKVDVYTAKWEGETIPNLMVHTLPIKGIQNHTRMRVFAKQLESHLKSTSYDLVVGFNKLPGLDVYYAADTCFQAKAHSKHGLWYRLTSRYRHWVNLEKAVFSTESSTQILLLSDLQQNEFMHYYKTPAERFYLLPPTLSKERVLPDNHSEIRLAKRQDLKLADDDFLLLMLGSGFKTKGLDRILLGIANLPSDLKNRTHLIIIGKDHSKKFIELAKTLQISQNITFLGGRDDVPDFLLAADLLLHPAYNENTGTALLEALVYGLPVITTDVCGYAKYVQAANAGVVLSSPFNQEQFNTSLQAMLLSPDRHAWKQNAISFTKQADLYSMTERAVDYIESLR